MMNRFEGPGGKEARIRYLTATSGPDARFVVRCAVTGEIIPIDELEVLSVARQEPYVNAEVSLQRELEMNPELRQRRKG